MKSFLLFILIFLCSCTTPELAGRIQDVPTIETPRIAFESVITNPPLVQQKLDVDLILTEHNDLQEFNINPGKIVKVILSDYDKENNKCELGYTLGNIKLVKTEKVKLYHKNLWYRERITIYYFETTKTGEATIYLMKTKKTQVIRTYSIALKIIE